MTKEIGSALQGLVNADYLAHTVDKNHPNLPSRMETIHILREALGDEDWSDSESNLVKLSRFLEE